MGILRDACSGFALFENLEDGATATQFIEWFPGVTLEQVRTVLDHAARNALAPA
jgi:uncharacterized protein (DUF433 family)